MTQAVSIKPVTRSDSRDRCQPWPATALECQVRLHGNWRKAHGKRVALVHYGAGLVLPLSLVQHQVFGKTHRKTQTCRRSGRSARNEPRFMTSPQQNIPFCNKDRRSLVPNRFPARFEKYTRRLRSLFPYISPETEGDRAESLACGS